MTNFTVENVTAAMERAVEAKGADYVYPLNIVDTNGGQCVYHETASDGTVTPSCIVGYVLAELDPEYFERVVEFEDETGNSFGIGAAFYAYEGTYQDEGLEENVPQIKGLDTPTVNDLRLALIKAQDAQDQGKTWGEAFDRYKDVLGI
jgi:hypothetical protein